MPDCPFCKIVAGEAEALIVGDFLHALAFIPLAPAAWGHTLVIPKRHVTDLFGLGDRADEVFYAVRYMDSALRKALSPDGMNLIQSTGTAAGQTVPHLHFHLMPRWEGDPLGDLWEKGREWWQRGIEAHPDGFAATKRQQMADAIRRP